MSKVRLLSKRDIDQAKAQDRQREIAEGVKLAKRVDELRGTLSKEESQAQLFREAATKQIQAEIASLLNQRDALKKEIIDLTTLREERSRIKKEVEDFLQAIKQ